MYIDTSDIKETFRELSGFNFSKNGSISALYEGKDQTFSVNNRQLKDKVFGMLNPDKIKEFSLLLIEYGNIEYCRKMAGIGIEKATRIIYFLNEAAAKRKLAPVYVFKKKNNLRNAKLCAKRVSYIKYLLQKNYSSFRLAKIYNVSQSTIMLIKGNLIWKDIDPVLMNTTQNEKIISLPYLSDPTQSSMLFNYIICENDPKCPRCRQGNPYILCRINTNYKCRNSNCGLHFNITAGTLFDNTKIKPEKWLAAMHIFNKNPSISTHKIAKQIGCTQKTGWRIVNRLKDLYITQMWQRFHVIDSTIFKKDQAA